MTASRRKFGLGAVALACVATAALTTLAFGGPADAITWPWQKPAITRDLAGYVSCSDPASVNGFSGSPSSLHLSGGGIDQTLRWPNKLAAQSQIFAKPTTGYYLVRQLKIPAGQDGVTMNYDLSCLSGDGGTGVGQKGSFPVGRSGYNRHICSYGGINNTCNPQLAERLGTCAFAAFAAGSDVLDAARVVSNPPSNPIQYIGEALGKIEKTGLLGVAISCASKPEVDSSPPERAVPVPTTPATVAPIQPPVTRGALPLQPVAPVATPPTAAPQAPSQPAIPATSPPTTPPIQVPATVAPPVSRTVREQSFETGSPTFLNPHNASGVGQRIQPNE